MAKHTLKIYRKIFKVCLAIFQHYAIKVNNITQIPFTRESHWIHYMNSWLSTASMVVSLVNFGATFFAVFLLGQI